MVLKSHMIIHIKILDLHNRHQLYLLSISSQVFSFSVDITIFEAGKNVFIPYLK